MPSTDAQSRPSAISLMVKSNSLRATKSIGAPCAGFPPAAPPPWRRRSRSSAPDSHPSAPAATFTSETNDGVEVCIDAQLVVARLRRHRLQPDARRRRVDQLAARHQRRGLRQPGRDTRSCGSPASPDSASRRRRRTRRTRADAGTASSSSRVESPRSRVSRVGDGGACRLQVWPRHSTRRPA